MPTAGFRTQRKTYSEAKPSPINHDLRQLEIAFERGVRSCDGLLTTFGRRLCPDIMYWHLASTGKGQKMCPPIRNLALKAQCRRYIDFLDFGMPLPNEHDYDIEKYPRQTDRNVLLRWDAAQQRYLDILHGDGVYTEFSWAAADYDIDNNELNDLYVGNGASVRSHDENRLLLNRSTKKKLNLSNDGAAGIALEADTRGLVFADFDHDGDGDLLTNNLFTGIRYFSNQSAGQALEIELRDNRTNYYGLGSTIYLETDKGTQVRAIYAGGHWNSSLPYLAHFGVRDSTDIQSIRVVWPDGAEKTYEGIVQGYRYVIYR